MRHVALVHNSASGQQSTQRQAMLRDALAVLQSAGIEAEVLETSGPGTARTCTEEAVRLGCDTVLACGGDGTVNEVLQCLVGTPVALGVVPLGTANALAQNLGLGSSPSKAVRLLLTAIPVQVPVGRIFYHDSAGAQHSRYFTVAAGIGVDALIMSRQDAGMKRRFGYALYVWEAFRVWAGSSFPLFETAFDSSGADLRVEEISQLLAVRIRSFGGLVGSLAPGASLHNSSLRLVAFRTRSRARYFTFLMALMVGRQTYSDGIELLDAISVECRARNGSEAVVHVEADGEVLGSLPVRIEMAPSPMALTLLIPPHAQP